MTSFIIISFVLLLWIGVACGVPYAIGMWLGGYVVKRLKIIKEITLSKFLMMILGISAALSLLLLPFGCSGIPIHRERYIQ